MLRWIRAAERAKKKCENEEETASEIIESDIVDEQIVSINEAMDLQMNEKLDDSIWNEKIDTDNDEPTINEFSTNNKFTQTDLESNDEKTLYYTGLPNAELLFLIHATVHSYLKPIRNKAALTTFQELILSLIKIRLNLPFTDLAYRFDISVSTASRIFRKTINVLAVCFSNLIVWPDRDVLLSTQPHYFSPSFKRVTVIIDCFEIYVEGSESLLANAESWSQYKHNKTIKVLVGITGQGTISFLSKAWGGRTSDKHIVENSGFLDHIIPGDVVLADRGFLIKDSLDSIGASLNIPAFTKGVNQLHPMDIEETRKLANVRIHVERVIGGLKNKFKILIGTLPVEMLHCNNSGDSFIDEILTTCGALHNLCPAIT
uniref:DDE Tnp4 domain-containing protein n=1 Tax=Trichogramma kaykai TaxID=54128 RepID=A0ABD2WFM6_9HYME